MEEKVITAAVGRTLVRLGYKIATVREFELSIQTMLVLKKYLQIGIVVSLLDLLLLLTMWQGIIEASIFHYIFSAGLFLSISMPMFYDYLFRVWVIDIDKASLAIIIQRYQFKKNELAKTLETLEISKGVVPFSAIISKYSLSDLENKYGHISRKDVLQHYV